MIRLSEVTLSYDKVSVLSGINYTFLQNEFTCIIGKNGCGKSTLLRAAAGITDYAGSITLNGVEMRLLLRAERAKRLSYLPQSRPVPNMDVATLIAHGRFPHLGFSKTLTAKDKEQIAYAAAVTGVDSLLHRNLSFLSGGERQRAYIAMMVAQDAELVLLDEPTTHLDIEHQLEVMELLKKLYINGKGIVMAVHDLPQAFSFASRILLIANGSIAAAGAPDEICSDSAVNTSFGVRVRKSKGEGDIYSYRITKGNQ